MLVNPRYGVTHKLPIALDREEINCPRNAINNVKVFVMAAASVEICHLCSDFLRFQGQIDGNDGVSVPYHATYGQLVASSSTCRLCDLLAFKALPRKMAMSVSGSTPDVVPIGHSSALELVIVATKSMDLGARWILAHLQFKHGASPRWTVHTFMVATCTEGTRSRGTVRQPTAIS